MDTRKARGKRKKAVLGPKEKHGLLQLVVSLLLFLMVFAGQEAFPEKREVWREELRAILQKDTDFRQVFQYLGEAVAEESPVLETLETVWVEVFGSDEVPMDAPSQETVLPLRMQLRQEGEAGWVKPERPVVPKETPVEIRDPVLAAVQQKLGLQESLTPVMGVLTSGYGMRKHPIDGVVRMHGGVDIAAEEGTEILAFSDATVDYIGESSDYGLYLQLRHENGVTTFYAHCSQLCVQKGQKVAMGEVVAKVGNTGVSTGPHLHLEMKKDGELLDPISFIHYLSV